MINILDLKAEYKSIKGEIDDAVHGVLDSGHFILGHNVSLIEKEVARYVGVEHAIGVASGTDALFLSLKALGIKEGDEVITTPLTFIATAEAISYTGAKPVFVDVDSDTHNIDPKQIERAITKNTKAILPVHLWGLPSEMDEINKIIEKHNLFVVEDCAQAFGAQYQNKKVGSLSDAGCFSFFPTKNLGAYGDGGMITTNNKNIYEKLKLLHLHGSRVRGIHEIIGYNSRLDEIQAAILRIKLKYIDKWNETRIKNASIYNELFRNEKIKCPHDPKNSKHVYHQYSIEIDKRDEVLSSLSAQGIAAFVYYPTPLHIQKAYDSLGYHEGDFPISEMIGKKMLSIPVHPFLTEDKIRFVADKVIKAVRSL